MSNIKQQKKRILTDKKRYSINRSLVSQTRTTVKKFNEMIVQNQVKEAKTELSKAMKLLDKLLNKKIKKINFITRQKTKLSKKLILKEKELFNKNSSEKSLEKK